MAPFARTRKSSEMLMTNGTNPAEDQQSNLVV
jgi:hypothetical protein